MFLVNAVGFSIFMCLVFVHSEIIVTSTDSDLDKFVDIRTESDLRDNGNSILESTTYKYPTATWSAPNYDTKKKTFSDLSKLYLFKPSPFLKPPFTEGDVGASITGIDDGVNVSGHRRGSWKKHQRRKPSSTSTTPVPMEQTTMTKKYSNILDTFLEESLTNYIRSRNLTDEFGTISVEMFSEALRRITEEKRFTMPPYDQNIELRKKFRDEILAPKKTEMTTPSGLLEKQYQRRLKKTWEVINENISVPSRSAVLERRNDWIPIELTTETTSTTFRSETPRTEVDITTITENTKSWTSSTFPEFILPSTSITTNSEITVTPSSLTGVSKIRSKTSRGKKKWRDSIRKMKANNNLDDGELQLSVAETVYFRPRQNPLQSFTYQYEPDFNSIPGQPEKDYPMLSSPPATGFRCPNLNGQGPKMMADRKARCQVFYICTGDGPAAPMLCPNGTMFNENVLVCDWWYNVDC